jgi:hypothetical protein
VLFYLQKNFRSRSIPYKAFGEKLKEQRRHSRIAAQINVTVEVQSAPGQESLAGRKLACQTRDISITGMCLFTDTQLPAETGLLVVIELGTPRKTFKLLGKVIWCAIDNEGGDGYKTGIHLLQLPGDAASWQAAVIQTLVG